MRARAQSPERVGYSTDGVSFGGADGLREEERNTVLRRADWRFLLPDPNPHTSVCFTNGRLARAVGLISRRLVDASDHAGECDLAVAVNPDQVTLRAAWSVLRPGGSCYTEWYLPTVASVGAVRRRLRAAGFERVTCYWAWPWPSVARTRFWIPLESEGAQRYFRASRPPSPNRLRHFARAVGRGLLTLGTQRLRTLPICAVACKPGDDDGQMEATSRLMLTGGHRTIHKVVHLVFRDPEPTPKVAVKFARVPESVPLLQREASMLQAVHGLRPGGIPGVPRLLASQQTTSGFTLTQTAVAGVPLYTQLTRANALLLAYTAADWLAELAVGASVQPRAAFWDRLIAPLWEQFRSTWGTVVEASELDRALAILNTLPSCPGVCEHRDFSPWNVLLTREGGVSVLDWEAAELNGLPALDLLYFLAHLGFFLDGVHVYRSRRFTESFQPSLSPTTFCGHIRQVVFEHYARRLRLDPAALAPLRLLVWMVHTRWEYSLSIADRLRTPTREELRQGVYLGLWRAELAALSS